MNPYECHDQTFEAGSSRFPNRLYTFLNGTREGFLCVMPGCITNYRDPDYHQSRLKVIFGPMHWTCLTGWNPPERFWWLWVVRVLKDKNRDEKFSCDCKFLENLKGRNFIALSNNSNLDEISVADMRCSSGSRYIRSSEKLIGEMKLSMKFSRGDKAATNWWLVPLDFWLRRPASFCPSPAILDVHRSSPPPDSCFFQNYGWAVGQSLAGKRRKGEGSPSALQMLLTVKSKVRLQIFLKVATEHILLVDERAPQWTPQEGMILCLALSPSRCTESPALVSEMIAFE
jgi:hypothetical protein